MRTPDFSYGPYLDSVQLQMKKRTGASSVSDPGLQTRAEVPVICEVMENGSLICSAKPVATVPATIVAAAVEAAERTEVELTLRDGSSAVGRLVEHRFVFKPRK